MIPRWILRNTAFNGCAQFVHGILVSQRGPAFIDLLLISGTDIEGGSIYVTGVNLCYMIGSFISGFLYSRVKGKSWSIAVALILAALVVGVTPLCSNFVSMLLVMSSTSVFTSHFETTIFTEQMRICQGESQSWALQFLSFTFSAGGIIGPLITEPFLSPKHTANSTKYEVPFNYTRIPSGRDGLNHISENHTLTLNERSASEADVSVRSNVESTDYSIRFAFLITAVLVFLAAIPFLIQCFRSRSEEVEKEESGEWTPTPRKLPRNVHFVIIVIASLYYVFFRALIEGFGQFLSFFVVNHLNWSKEDGALLTAVFWASTTFAKLAFIFLTLRLQMGAILLASNIGMVISCLGFTLGSEFHLHYMVWVFTAVLASSVAALFGGGMAWLNVNLLQMDGKATAALEVASALGATLMPIPIGMLMKAWTRMAFAYVMLGLSCLDLLVMLVLLFITKPLIRRKYGPPTLDLEVQVSLKENDTDLAKPEDKFLKTATTHRQ